MADDLERLRLRLRTRGRFLGVCCFATGGRPLRHWDTFPSRIHDYLQVKSTSVSHSGLHVFCGDCFGKQGHTPSAAFVSTVQLT